MPKPPDACRVDALGPTAVASRAWRRGSTYVTFVAKATFALTHGGRAALVPAESIGEDGAVSDTELAPYLEHAGVVVRGAARAPAGTLVREMRVGVAVQDGSPPFTTHVDKWIDVTGDRSTDDAFPDPFSEMPLLDELSYGGVGFEDNPTGLGATGDGPRPNLTAPENPSVYTTLGPVPRERPQRRRLLRGMASSALDAPAPQLPGNFAWAFFHTAPVDQQLRWLRGDERIVLRGFSAEHPTFEVTLPGVAFRGRARRGADLPAEDLSFHVDFASIDADAMRCHVVARATFSTELDELPDVHAVVGVSVGGDGPTWPRGWDVSAGPALGLVVEEALTSTTIEASSVQTLKDAIAAASIRSTGVTPSSALPFPASVRGEPPAPLEEALPERFGFTKPAYVGPIVDDATPALEVDAEPAKLSVADAGAQGRSRAETSEVARALVERVRSGASPAGLRLRDADLRGVDLSGASLAGLDLSGARLERANLVGVSLVGAKLVGADLTDADASGARLDRADLTRAILRRTRADRASVNELSLDEAVLEGATLREARGVRTRFVKAELRGVDASKAELYAADFSSVDWSDGRAVSARLDRSRFGGARIRGVALDDASLVASRWSRATVDGASLQRALLSHARLDECVLTRVNLAGADLRDADLRRARWTGCDATGVDLRTSDLEGAALKDVALVRANAVGVWAVGLVGENVSLDQARLDGAALVDSELVATSCVGASLRSARLEGARWAGVILARADLSNVHARGANLRGADLQLARLDGAHLEEADLMGAVRTKL